MRHLDEEVINSDEYWSGSTSEKEEMPSKLGPNSFNGGLGLGYDLAVEALEKSAWTSEDWESIYFLKGQRKAILKEHIK